MNNDRELKKFRFIEKSLPGRINMRCVAGTETTGWLCCGCEEVVPHLSSICKCPEWIEVHEKANGGNKAMISRQKLMDELDTRIDSLNTVADKNDLVPEATGKDMIQCARRELERMKRIVLEGSLDE